MTDKPDDSKTQAYDFIMKNRVAALATNDSKGQPDVAIVYCVAHKDLSLYFSTRVEGRKFINLMARPTVAMTFFNEASLKAIRLTGVAERIENLEEENKVLYDLLTFRHEKFHKPLLPPLELFEHGATNEVAIIKVTPSEMTYANFDITETGRYKSFYQKII